MPKNAVSFVFDDRNLKRFLDDVHNTIVAKALPSTLNRTMTKFRTQVKRQLSRRTGIKQKDINDLSRITKASRARSYASYTLRSRTPNAIRFNARETKTGLKSRMYRKTVVNTKGFIGNSGATAFRRTGTKRLPIEPVYGPNVARALGSKVARRASAIFINKTLSDEFSARYKFFASRINSRKRR